MNQALAPLFSYTLPYHIFFANALFFSVLFYLVLTQFFYKKPNYTLYIRYYLPAYHTLLACAIFTGIILLATFDFSFSHKSGVMSLVSVFLIASSAIGFKRLKLYARAKELDKFRRFALFKGLIDLGLVALLIGM